MSIKTLMATVCGAFLAVSAMGARAQDTKAEDKTCCTSACTKHDSGKMRCSLTGKVVDSCCCVKKEGKLHCNLADKDVETCCCKPVDESDKTDDEQAGQTDDAPAQEGARR
jgi:hypothetical protein